MAHRVISRERDIQVAFGAKLTSTGGQYWRARSQMNPKATLARLSWTGRSASGGETAMTLEVLQSKLIERVNRFGPGTPKLVYACGVRDAGGAWMVGAAAARRSERLRVRGG